MHMAAVLMQGEGAQYRVVAMTGRDLTPAEAKLPEVERYLVGSVWALHHLVRYTMYLPLVKLVFPMQRC